jgi:hypothetical protein
MLSPNLERGERAAILLADASAHLAGERLIRADPLIELSCGGVHPIQDLTAA